MTLLPDPPGLHLVLEEKIFHDFVSRGIRDPSRRPEIGIDIGVQGPTEITRPAVWHGGGSKQVVHPALVFQHHHCHDVTGRKEIPRDIDHTSQIIQPAGFWLSSPFLLIGSVSQMGQGAPSRDVVAAPVLGDRRSTCGDRPGGSPWPAADDRPRQRKPSALACQARFP
jgi:hypothetical protein